ncbi:outer membrane beta-barrel protein [Proteiniphilum acetatigenes]|uniref:outer membrane beta-barrel protein n=1 Tax=Proteiniphilum acetatigenes TaxID=294710 RepID=UPI000370B5D2|nr:outer membrane beta-barrel protein [Proteiniphilum acetatigenes]
MKRSAQCFLIGLLFSVPLFWQGNLHAQSTFSDSKGAIGITYSGLGDNDAFYFESLDGAGGYVGKGYYSLGITYIRPLTKRLDIETGISYSKYTYQFSNASLGPDAPEPYNVTNAVVDIPVTVRWAFLKYFFLNGGLLLGIDTGKENHLDSQTGIGATIGVGAKYNLKNIPVGLFVNLYYKMHNLIPFSMENYHQRTDESGFRLGVVYYLH